MDTNRVTRQKACMSRCLGASKASFPLPPGGLAVGPLRRVQGGCGPALQGPPRSSGVPHGLGCGALLSGSGIFVFTQKLLGGGNLHRRPPSNTAQWPGQRLGEGRRASGALLFYPSAL